MEQTKIDSYLFNEMPDAEREQIEEDLLSDDDLFYEIATRENDLVDRYVAGELAGDALTRFEASLAANPARQQKVANGRALREYIADEQASAAAKTITIAERSGFLSRISDLFAIPAYQFASIGMILLLGAATLFLTLEYSQSRSLESELAAARQRESELAARIETADETTGDLTSDLAAERQRIQALEAEIARLISTGSNVSPPASGTRPTIATLILPSVIRRSGPPVVHRLELPSGVTRVSVVASLPPEMSQTERVSATLNGKPVVQNARVRVGADGVRTVTLSIAASGLNETRNELTVTDDARKISETYLFSTDRGK